jgi:hypothetical protein
MQQSTRVQIEQIPTGQGLAAFDLAFQEPNIRSRQQAKH